LELSGIYPNLQGQLPIFRVHPIYGRHFDVLEALLNSLEEGQELRMAELGVACGPIGLHLLARFPQLQYFGADPTIKDEVRKAYTPYRDRATLFATTSEEMHARGTSIAWEVVAVATWRWRSFHGDPWRLPPTTQSWQLAQPKMCKRGWLPLRSATCC